MKLSLRIDYTIIINGSNAMTCLRRCCGWEVPEESPPREVFLSDIFSVSVEDDFEFENQTIKKLKHDVATAVKAMRTFFDEIEKVQKEHDTRMETFNGKMDAQSKEQAELKAQTMSAIQNLTEELKVTKEFQNNAISQITKVAIWKTR